MKILNIRNLKPHITLIKFTNGTQRRIDLSGYPAERRAEKLAAIMGGLNV